MQMGVWIATKQGLCTLIDRDGHESIDPEKVYIQTRGSYRRAFYIFNGKPIYLHRFIVTAPDGLTVDHIDRDALNNKKENLRICTQGLNNQNRAKSSRSKGRFKGILVNEKGIFYEYSKGGKNHRVGPYYSQKMAFNDYCETKTKQVGSYFYADTSELSRLEQVVPRKALLSKLNKTGFVGVVRVGSRYLVSFKGANGLVQKSGYTDPLDAAKEYDRLMYEYRGLLGLYNFPEDYTVFL